MLYARHGRQVHNVANEPGARHHGSQIPFSMLIKQVVLDMFGALRWVNDGGALPRPHLSVPQPWLIHV